MKKPPLLAFTLAFVNEISAQPFKITPDTVIIINGLPSSNQLIGAGKFTNTTKDKRTCNWSRINRRLPIGCVSTTCVPSFCYTEKFESGSFELEGGISGTRQSTLQLYDVANPKEVVKVRYVATSKDCNNRCNN